MQQSHGCSSTIIMLRAATVWCSWKDTAYDLPNRVIAKYTRFYNAAIKHHLVLIYFIAIIISYPNMIANLEPYYISCFSGADPFACHTIGHYSSAPSESTSYLLTQGQTIHMYQYCIISNCSANFDLIV